MSKTEAKTKGVQVSATIPADLHAVLEDHRWDVRMTFTELVGHALKEYALAQKLITADEKAADSKA